MPQIPQKSIEDHRTSILSRMEQHIKLASDCCIILRDFTQECDYEEVHARVMAKLACDQFSFYLEAKEELENLNNDGVIFVTKRIREHVGERVQ